MVVASQTRMILIRSSVESTESDSRRFKTSGLGFGALPRPPESHSYFGSCTYVVCSCILPFLSMDLAPGIIFVVCKMDSYALVSGVAEFSQEELLLGENLYDYWLNFMLALMFIYGSLPRPPDVDSLAVCTWFLNLLSKNIDSRMISVDSGIICNGDDIVAFWSNLENIYVHRKGELRFEQHRHNHTSDVDTRCLDLAGIGMICVFDLSTFCRIASSLGISSASLILEDCCEFLYLVSMACEATAMLLSFRRLRRTHTAGYIATLLVFVAVGLLQLSIATLLVFLQGQKEDCFFPHCSHKLENYFSKLQSRFGVYKSQVLTLKVVTHSGGLKTLLWFLFGSLSRPPEAQEVTNTSSQAHMDASLIEKVMEETHMKFYKSKSPRWNVLPS